MKRANRPWTKDEWDVVTATAMPHLLAPILLAGVLGWREGEVVSRPRTDYDRAERRIKRISAKSGKLVKTPVPALLADALNALQPHNATTLLVSSRGKPWTFDGFNSSFRKFIIDLRRLGVVDEGLTFHGLRHTMATRASWASTRTPSRICSGRVTPEFRNGTRATPRLRVSSKVSSTRSSGGRPMLLHSLSFNKDGVAEIRRILAANASHSSHVTL
jgi:integrase